MFSCSHQRERNKDVVSPKSFSTLEITFDSQVAHESFSFVIDSNKIYISPQNETAYYGILPDSLYKLINSVVSEVRTNESIKSTHDQCIDCSVLAIKIVKDNDTIKLRQSGQLSKVFYPVIDSLQSFLKTGTHEKINARIYMLETSLMAVPPPESIGSKKNKTNNKSGR
jgi:hypothetical protein